MSLFNNAFSRPESFFQDTPELKTRQEIKNEHRVDPSSTQMRSYAPGVGRALALFLTGELKILQDDDGETFVARYSTSTSGEVTGVSRKQRAGPGSSTLKWSATQAKPFDHMSSASALALACGLLDAARFPLTHQALRAVVALTGFPVNSTELKLMPQNNPLLVGAIHYLSDALYTETMDQVEAGKIVVDKMRETSVPTLKTVSAPEMAKVLGVWRDPVSVPRNTPKDQLRRLTRRGGAALLVGPPATFKTTTARKVAVAEGCPVVEMRGNPGIEDRDLFGTFLRAPGGETTWVDGPLPQVFAHAKRGRVIAIIDEIMRFLPETTNVFITVMNQLDYEDCELLLRPMLEATQLSESEIQAALDEDLPERDGRYHMLTLPNGDVMFALKKNITFIATTNFGDSYIQVSPDLDPALMSRFDLVIDVPRADADDVRPIYTKVAGRFPRLAQFAIDLEDRTYTETADDNALLVRPLDPRKMIAFLQEAVILLEEGHTFQDAVLMACGPTVIPHVCPREADGSLEPTAVRRITDIITEDVLPTF